MRFLIVRTDIRSRSRHRPRRRLGPTAADCGTSSHHPRTTPADRARRGPGRRTLRWPGRSPRSAPSAPAGNGSRCFPIGDPAQPTGSGSPTRPACRTADRRDIRPPPAIATPGPARTEVYLARGAAATAATGQPHPVDSPRRRRSPTGTTAVSTSASVAPPRRLRVQPASQRRIRKSAIDDGGGRTRPGRPSTPHRPPGQRRADLPAGEPAGVGDLGRVDAHRLAGSARGQEAQHQRAGERPGLAADVRDVGRPATPTSSATSRDHRGLGRLPRLDVPGQAGVRGAGPAARPGDVAAEQAAPVRPGHPVVHQHDHRRVGARPDPVARRRRPGDQPASSTVGRLAGGRRVAVPGVPVAPAPPRW